MTKEEQVKLLRSVREDTLPDYVLKRLYSETETEEETKRADQFCKRLAELLGVGNEIGPEGSSEGSGAV